MGENCRRLKWMDPYYIGNLVASSYGLICLVLLGNTTIRVSNLHENTEEADLREQFKPFGGEIADIYFRKSKKKGRVQGYVCYTKKDDATKVFAKLNSYEEINDSYDDAILKIALVSGNLFFYMTI